MNKYTITQFRKDYPDDDACLDKIWQLRFTGLVCPICEGEHTYHRTTNRRSYQCSNCSHQIYPTQGTIFEKSTTPLTHWFYAIYLQTTTRNGVAAKELERQLNICYKTALRMAHQIKKLMADKSLELLNGTIEADETFIYGKEENKHRNKKKKNTGGRNLSNNKFAILGLMQRGERVKTFVIPDTQAETLQSITRANVEKQSRIITDAYVGYVELRKDYTHETIKHTYENYITHGDKHTNNIEGFWSCLKRTIKGTHIHVSGKHLQKYADEVAFRYQYRKHQDEMFNEVLKRVV